MPSIIKSLKFLGFVAGGLGLIAKGLSDYVEEKELEAKIDERFEKLYAERIKEDEENEEDEED